MDQNLLPRRGPKLFTARRSNTLQTRREKLPWPPDKPFKILSLDGGGIRGLYGACLLAQIERDIIQGEHISEYFDMIAGTSTGGIMALALGLNVPAERIEHLYKKDGKDIFKQNRWWRWISCLKACRQFFSPLYDHSVLERVLNRELGDKTLGESVTRLVIPAFMTPKTEITVFKTDHHPDFKNDHKSKAWEIARATSAAPTYLGGHAYDDVIFLDGGVWANNPVLVAVIDALSAYDIRREQIEILSFGTGNLPFEVTLQNSKRGLWSWRAVIKAAMFLTTDNAHAQAALLLGPEQITRLEPSENAAKLELDDWEGAVKILPSMAAEHFQKNKDVIARFFQSKTLQRHRFYT